MPASQRPPQRIVQPQPARPAQPVQPAQVQQQPMAMMAPPEDIPLYMAPGMQTITFAECLMGAGIPRDLGEWVERTQEALSEMRQQIEELRNR